MTTLNYFNVRHKFAYLYQVLLQTNFRFPFRKVDILIDSQTDEVLKISDSRSHLFLNNYYIFYIAYLFLKKNRKKLKLLI